MKLITSKPWWWFITGKPWGSVALTWGNTVYCAEDKVREDILVHERVHIKQCKGKWYISLWFLIRCMVDDKFYQKLEREAKNEQIKYVLKYSGNNGRRSK